MCLGWLGLGGGGGGEEDRSHPYIAKRTQISCAMHTSFEP